MLIKIIVYWAMFSMYILVYFFNYDFILIWYPDYSFELADDGYISDRVPDIQQDEFQFYHFLCNWVVITKLFSYQTKKVCIIL